MAASPWGFRCMVLPTMFADLVRAPLIRPMLIHRIQQLAVGGLEAVDLRQGAADDDAHGVGHIVRFQRAGDGVFQHTAGVQYLNALAQLGRTGFAVFLLDFFAILVPL